MTVISSPKPHGIALVSTMTASAIVVMLCLTLLISLSDATPALAATTPVPAWQATTVGIPTVLPGEVGRKGVYDVVVENIGGAPSEGPVVVRNALPAGLTVTGIKAEPIDEGPECSGEGSAEVVCTFVGSVVPSGFIVVAIQFMVTKSLSAGALLEDATSVSGGSAMETSGTASIRVRAEAEQGPGPAGINHFTFEATGPAGEGVAQADGHPNFLTTSVLFNNMFVEHINEPSKPVEAIKNLVFYLPLGMLGNPTAASTCPVSLVETQQERTGCPPGSLIGSILPMVLGNVFAHSSENPTHVRPVFNVVPEKGYPAEFAFTSNNYTFFSYASIVRRHGAYMVRIAIPGVPAIASLIGFVATFYGDIQEHFASGETQVTFDRGAFLTNPGDCQEGEETRQASVAADTWEHQDKALPLRASAPVFTSLIGCELLSFSTRLRVSPETAQADAPSGYEVGLEVPQEPSVASRLSTPSVKSVRLTLPQGTAISPSSANGLVACEETGPAGINIEGPESEEIAADGLERPVPGHCSLASQIGTVKASTPLLHEELEGHLFLARPGCGGDGQNACTVEDAEDGKLFGLYLELQSPVSGVVIKLKGQATVQAGTGQITASFDEGPQFPFSNLTVSMKHGPRAPLANPQACGPADSGVVVRPWSSPATPDAIAKSTFGVDWNGSGGECPASDPFAPAFEAGTTSPTAAATSPFTLTLKREDREQNPNTLSTTLPEGLLANISKVARCPEPQASQDSLAACPASSQIGTTTVAVGPGSDPYYVQGKVFFTGPYKNAPFGLSVVVPAVAGPFNLGDVLVRARLSVDPHTSQATAVSDPLPQELDGVPLRMRVLNITLTNEEFVLNPTSCRKMSIDATATSTTGGIASLSSPFIAKGCNKLAFNPAFGASTEAKATKANGTGVRLKISYPSSGEANIAKTVLGFPKQLPVRLETLQKACLAATFEANPAACPAASNVGTATVHTPILSSPLTGPIYLVSYGSAKFPDAVVVLQGEGITLEVDGQSFVSKAGALTATFASVPDAPFSTFEASLPAGPFSQFTSVRTSGKAQGSQCGENLRVPVTMVAHNGAEVKKSVPMQISGCPISVAILKARVAGGHLVVSVRTTARGRLTIRGAGLRTLVKPGLAAGTHKLSIALTAAGRVAARRHRKIGLSVGLVVGKRKTMSHKRVAL